MAARATAAELRKRINQVTAMLVTGATRADIVQFGSEKWGVTSRAVDKYIAAATAELKEAAKSAREDDLAMARGIYTLLIREQTGRKDFRGASLTAGRLCQLLGLNAPERKELSGPDGEPIEFVERAKDIRERLTGRIAGIAASSRAGERPSESD